MMYKNFVFLSLFLKILLTKQYFCAIIVIVLNTDLSSRMINTRFVVSFLLFYTKTFDLI